MALSSLNNKLNKLRDTAAATQANHREWVASIRADERLSSTGKNAELAKRYLSASRTLRDLDRQEREALENTRAELERKMFGQFSNDPSAIIAYRDAQDRASALTEKDQAKALNMMHTAKLAGDTTLQTALISRALSAGWDRVISQYNADNPDVAGTLKDLADVVHFQTDPDVQFNATSAYSLMKPQELGRHTDATLERIAAEEQPNEGQMWGESGAA
ncbi:hypothetical protein [Microbacterium imperiale]|uniref:Uncharacterized protein n=1 Tax=Microbacterium imperiale TaxID=33884 RepID=A0A9W6M3A2_9MICO|nr:hypothetical protein [Microbacterium imperiale]MBP2422068.1 multidrug efflux pump subunit AcrA (membrane-fusion protein) [Microbacterium imperiale]MDS0200225.1 hypothetical protein [Microbacterium imperiale]BFE39377.1 hypothetical protein GCM10017544_03330 [Microbacterium imperiale]GLJ79756.1 hypothetical protein GCM10017586_14380 [Microbacterium imperiale]